MTRKQVRRLSGAPAVTQGRCWIFHPKDGKVGAITLVSNNALFKNFKGPLRLCFTGDVFSDAQERFFENGRWKWEGWVPSLRLVSPTVDQLR